MEGSGREFFKPNIGTAGRVARLLGGIAVGGGGVALCWYSLWLATPILALGVFMIIEGLRGWCLARACGLKTRL